MDPKFKLPGLEFFQFISSGGFGSVYQYKSKFTGRFYAVKQVEFLPLVKNMKSANNLLTDAEAMEKAEKYMMREVEIQFLIQEEERKKGTIEWNMPLFYFVCANPDSPKDFLFVCEFCENSSLRKLIDEVCKNKTPFPEKEVLRIIYGVLKAVKTLHSLNLAHRDISPDNILFDAKNVPKLIDFGAGRRADSLYSKLTFTFSKANYAPPELDDPNFAYTDEILIKGDIWELGIVLYEMIDPPLNPRKIFLLGSKNYASLEKTPYSKDLKVLVEKICLEDYKFRPSVDEILKNDLFKDFIV